MESPSPESPCVRRRTAVPLPILTYRPAKPKPGIYKLVYDIKKRTAELSTAHTDAWQGDVLLATTPFFPTLNTALLSSHCAGCWKLDDDIAKSREGRVGVRKKPLLACGRCGVFHYCQWRCVARDFGSHYDECRALVRTGGDMPSTLVRLVSNVVWARGTRTCNPKIDYVAKHKLPPLTSAHEVHVQSLAAEVSEFVAPRGSGIELSNYNLPDEIALANLVRRVMTCLFPLYDLSALMIGIGISPRLSRLKHSCRPNATVVFPKGPKAERGMQVVSVDPIYSGEEVTISYLDRTIPTHLREALLVPLGFTHNCDYCRSCKVDLRWCALHDGCEQDGDVSLPGSAMAYMPGEDHVWDGSDTAKNSPKPADNTCASCKAVVSTDTISKTYQEISTAWSDEWIAEMEGVRLPLTRDIAKHRSRLMPLVDKMTDHIPSTVYPLPYLIRRLARLHITLYRETTSKSNADSNALEMLQDSMDCLGIAFDSVTLANSHEPSPLGLAILVELVEAHVEYLARVKRDLLDRVTEVSFTSVADECRLSSPPPIEGSRNSAPPEILSSRTDREKVKRRAMTYPLPSSSRAHSNGPLGIPRAKGVAVKNTWATDNGQATHETIKRAREYVLDAKSDARSLALSKTDLGRGLEEQEIKLEGLAVWFETLIHNQGMDQSQVEGQ